MPPGVEGVTAEETAQREPRPPSCAVPEHRLDGVLAAGRQEATPWAEQWTDELLVAPQRDEQHPGQGTRTLTAGFGDVSAAPIAPGQCLLPAHAGR